MYLSVWVGFRYTVVARWSFSQLTRTSKNGIQPPFSYVRGLSERIEKVYRPLGVKAVFKPMQTLRQTLTKVKTEILTTIISATFMLEESSHFA